VLFVGNGAPMFIEGFVEREKLADLPITIVTDPSLKVFEAADLERSVMSTVGAKAIKAAWRARKAGYRQPGIEGDKLQQGGMLLLDRGGAAVFYHRNDHLGHHADPQAVVAAARTAAAA
jgi:hypothetical protein